MTPFPSGPKRNKRSGNGFNERNYKARDGVSLAGWSCKADNGMAESSGTIILGHGFMANSDQIYDRACFFRHDCNLNVCAVDFRNHGNSEAHAPTFGLAESWDLEAVLRYAKSVFPSPYYLYGESLGGMAAQLLTQRNTDISAAVLMCPPADAWTAVWASAGPFIENLPIPNLAKKGGYPLVVAISKFISAAYSSLDILGEGSLYRGASHPEHEPHFLYLMGENDKFGHDKTLSCFKWLYPTCPAYDGGLREKGSPELIRAMSELSRKKYFLSQQGAGHGKLNGKWVKDAIMEFLSQSRVKARKERQWRADLADADGVIIRSCLTNALLSASLSDAGERWRLVPSGNGDWFMAVNIATGKCLDVEGWHTYNSASVIMYETHGGSNQLWRPVNGDHNGFMLLNKRSKRCMDLDMGDKHKLQIWDAWNSQNQCWRIE
jgi:pimeloyl-ACP methyl ester carboxylesterase